VGIAALIRVSSVMLLLSSRGTFRSQRTRTFLPARSVREETEAFTILMELMVMEVMLGDLRLLGVYEQK